jgi:hypothetical protein
VAKQRLSKADQAFVAEHFGKLPLAEIAAHLGATEALVEKHAGTLARATTPEAEAAGVALRASAAYRQLAEEFNPVELAYFDEQYVALVRQFNDDVPAAERQQIFKAIKYEILMGRNLRRQKKAEEAAGAAEAERDALRRKSPRPDDAAAARLLALQTIVDENLAAIQAATKEYATFDKQHQQLMEDLKATRKQRDAKLDASKTSFLDLIKTLDDEDEREREGRQMARMKLATEKELKRLGADHTYADGTVDKPILSPDTV